MEVITAIIGYFYNAKCIWSKERSLVPSPSGAGGLMFTLHRGKPLEQTDRYVARGSRSPMTESGALMDLRCNCFSGWFFFSSSSWNNMSSRPYQRGVFLTFSWGYVLHALGHDKMAGVSVWRYHRPCWSNITGQDRVEAAELGAVLPILPFEPFGPISKITVLFWFGGNRWFTTPKESLDVNKKLFFVGSWGPRSSGEAGS